jgi:hypothetical protein
MVVLQGHLMSYRQEPAAAVATSAALAEQLHDVAGSDATAVAAPESQQPPADKPAAAADG